MNQLKNICVADQNLYGILQDFYFSNHRLSLPEMKKTLTSLIMM